MVSVFIQTVKCQVKTNSRLSGERLLYSTAFSSDNLKSAFLQVRNFPEEPESLHNDIVKLNLGAISAAQFSTQFNQRLVQAFAQYLIQKQAPKGKQQSINNLTSNATKLQVLLNECHQETVELLQQSLCCLQPSTLELLLQETPTNQLQQLLKLLLEHVWQSPKMLPACWYDRVTASRLSIAAILYLLDSQQGGDWLMSKHSPTASQLADWTKAISLGEIPPEQVVCLLTGNHAAISILPGQCVYPPLIVKRWLLPLWQQPVVRQVIRRMEGRRSVQLVDAYLSSCLQLNNDAQWEDRDVYHYSPHVASTALAQDGEMHSDFPQVANTALAQGGEMHSDFSQVVSTTLGQDREMHSDFPQVASTALAQGGEMHSDFSQVVSTTLGQDREIHSDFPQVTSTALTQIGEIRTISRSTMKPKKDNHLWPNEPPSSGQVIGNAGLLLLWPLLPQLFSLLGLWEEKQFASDVARWQAVYSLDQLVWGEVKPSDGLLTLNQMLCEISHVTPVPRSIPLNLMQYQQIDNWLSEIGQQLAGWQKLSLTDIRQLFLQRTGEISMEGTIPKIVVHSEPYDFLLRDWPWPITLASFPWTEQPLTIVWPLNGYIG